MPPSPLLNHTTALTTSLSSPTSAVTQHRNASTAAHQSKMYTTSFAFFEALWDAGVEHVFVNLGSDHPSIIEAMVKGSREKKGQFPRIITCPNEVSFRPSSLSILPPPPN